MFKKLVEFVSRDENANPITVNVVFEKSLFGKYKPKALRINPLLNPSSVVEYWLTSVVKIDSSCEAWLFRSTDSRHYTPALTVGSNGIEEFSLMNGITLEVVSSYRI
ncbi:hypothetical protein QUR06_000251 [Escherichia coli]|nr:hypothetical protein [Escherichia coli]